MDFWQDRRGIEPMEERTPSWAQSSILASVSAFTQHRVITCLLYTRKGVGRSLVVWLTWLSCSRFWRSRDRILSEVSSKSPDRMERSPTNSDIRCSRFCFLCVTKLIWNLERAIRAINRRANWRDSWLADSTMSYDKLDQTSTRLKFWNSFHYLLSWYSKY